MESLYLFVCMEFSFLALSAESGKSEGKGDFSSWVLGPGDGSWHPGGHSGVFVDIATGSSTHRSKAVELLTPLSRAHVPTGGSNVTVPLSTCGV